MIEVSDRWADTVPRTPRWVTAVDWSANGTDWHTGRYIEGSITDDLTSTVRWESQIAVRDIRLSTALKSGIDPYGCRYRIRLGMWHSPGWTEWIHKGVYRVESAQASTESPVVELEGLSYEQQVIDARFEAPRTIHGGTRQNVIEDLVREIVDDAVFSWRVDGSDDVKRVTVEKDRWSVIDGRDEDPSLARAMGARVACNGAGFWVVAPVPSLDDAAVWQADTGPDGVLLVSTERLTREGVRNVVSASYAPTDGSDPGPPGVARDMDPLSRTYALRPVSEGGFGQVILYYASPQLTTLTSREKAARTLLAPRLGLKQQVDFQTLYDPAKEAGDVGLVKAPDGTYRKVIIDRLTLDPATASMQADTRTTATRLAGEISADPDLDEQEGLE